MPLQAAVVYPELTRYASVALPMSHQRHVYGVALRMSTDRAQARHARRSFPALLGSLFVQFILGNEPPASPMRYGSLDQRLGMFERDLARQVAATLKHLDRPAQPEARTHLLDFHMCGRPWEGVVVLLH